MHEVECFIIDSMGSISPKNSATRHDTPLGGQKK